MARTRCLALSASLLLSVTSVVEKIPKGSHRHEVVAAIDRHVDDHRHLERVVVNQPAADKGQVVRLDLDDAVLHVLVLETGEAVVGRAEKPPPMSVPSQCLESSSMSVPHLVCAGLHAT